MTGFCVKRNTGPKRVKLINFYPPTPQNHQKTYDFLIIFGGIEVN